MAANFFVDIIDNAYYVSIMSKSVNQHEALIQFIEAKVSAYTPPAREGTPKGDAIGFSPEKYAASLWALTNLEQKQIAEKVNCNYRSLLTWRSQSDFKTLTIQHAAEFAKILINATQATLSQEVKGEARSFLQAAFVILNEKGLDNSLGDASKFSNVLVKAITDSLDKRMQRIAESIKSEPENISIRQYAIIANRLSKWLLPYASDRDTIILLEAISRKSINIIMELCDSFISYILDKLPPDDATTLKAVFVLYSSLHET